MKQERYAQIVREFESLLHIGAQVSMRLVGTHPEQPHLSYADSIYTKLLCHAISLHKISPQLVNKPPHELWDLPSACAISRCIIEAHDVLGYMVFSDASPEERAFRVLVWRLHDQQRRSRMLRSIESKDPQAEHIHNAASQLLAEATSHPWYPNVAKHLQKKIVSGDAPVYLISQRELNAANSVNHEYHTSATMWLSQYVHTLPMSVHQLADFKAGTPEALQICSMPIQYALGFLAKTISKMAATFENGNMSMPNEYADIFYRWCLVVARGVSTTGTGVRGAPGSGL